MAQRRPSTAALFAAIRQQDVARVQDLMTLGLALDRPNAEGDTPLTAAAAMGSVAILQRLIAAGANVMYGLERLPLHLAAEAGHLDCVRVLLDAGVAVDAYEEGAWTALMAAASAGHLVIVQLLVQRRV